MMTRRDHQKNITRATKRSGRPDKVLWVIVWTTYVSSCAHRMWQSRPQKTKSTIKALFSLLKQFFCFPRRAAIIVTFLWGTQTHLNSQQQYGHVPSPSLSRLNMVPISLIIGFMVQFLEAEWERRETDHPSPCNTKVKNAWSYTPPPPNVFMYPW